MPKDERTESRKLLDAANAAVMAFIASTDTSDLPPIFHVAFIIQDKDDSSRVLRYWPIRNVNPAKERRDGNR